MDNRPVFQWTTDTLFSRERFEAWLAEQPGEREFDFVMPHGCAAASFVRETSDLQSASAGGNYIRPGVGREDCILFPRWLYTLLFQVRVLPDGDMKREFTIAQLRTTYHKLFNIDVMEAHASVTPTPQPERV